MAEYITKDEAILQLTGINLPKDRDSYIALVTKRLQDISAADVAPVIHAKWKHIDETHDICMNCGVVVEIVMHGEGDTNYCPNCGAKMEI